MRRLALIYLTITALAISVCCPAFPDAPPSGLMITAVTLMPREQEPHTAYAAVTVNRAVQIKEIRVSGELPAITYTFPAYISSRQRVFPQITALDPATRRIFHQALSAGVAESPAVVPKLERTAVTCELFRRRSRLKAFAAVTFNGALRVECKIIESDAGLWVAWPARRPKGGGSWIKQVVFLDDALRRSTEAAVLNRYREACRARSAAVR